MNGRRLLLTRAAKILALTGAGFAAWPFVAALLPETGIDTARAQRWRRDIDPARLAPGELLQIDDWPGGPVAVYRRTSDEIAGLARVERDLHDPHSVHSRQPYALRTATRSAVPQFFVFVPAETARGCALSHVPPDRPPQPGIAWYGGFVDRCAGSLYDTAGRVYRVKRGAAQQNLAVPAHTAAGAQHITLQGPAPAQRP